MRHPKPFRRHFTPKPVAYNEDMTSCCACGKPLVPWRRNARGICHTGETTAPFGLVFCCAFCFCLQWGFSTASLYFAFCEYRLKNGLEN